MRPSHARRLLSASLLVLLASCTGESAEPAPQVRAPARPPAKKTAPAAQKPAPAPEPAVASMLPSGKPARVLPKTSAPRALPRATSASGPFDTAQLGSRGLLHWLPRDAFLVVRLPHVESLGEIRQRSALGGLLQNPAVMMALASPQGPLAGLQKKIHAELPELEALLERLPELEGDLVLGLAHAEAPRPDSAGGAAVPKLTFALAFDAGEDADSLQRTLDPLLARLKKECGAECAKPEGAWGLIGWQTDACFEIRRFGDVFTALVGNDPEFAGGIRPGAAEPSFAGAALVASAADLNGAQKGLFELYLHADPAWDLVREQAPPQAREALDKLGLFGVHGVALALGLGEKGLSEAHTWSAPAHADVLSRVLAGAPASRELARWIPEDASTAGLYQFDLNELYQSIVGLLPADALLEMRRGLEECKTQTGIDVEADIVQNLGPSFAMVSRGDPLGFLNGPAGVCLAIQTHDDDRASVLIGKLLPLLPPELKRHDEEFAGRALLSFDLAPLGMPLTSLCLCRVDGAVLVATDQRLLERCLLAGKEPGLKQAVLAQALAGEDVIGASLSAPVGDLPATLAVLRKTSSGLVLSSADGSGSLGSACVTVVPVLAAVGIPKLMSARLEANEAAAAATLRSIASAEAQFQAAGVLDLDQDGMGEYGTLGELTGTAKLRGSNEVLVPAVLPGRPAPDAKGIWTRSGYHFSVYLPMEKDGAQVCTDEAEVHYSVIAWPVDAGATGGHLYAIDSEGDLLRADNFGGLYSGLDERPSRDGFVPEQKGVDRSSGKPYIGRDGLTWQMVANAGR
jgi:hypothetical protein